MAHGIVALSALLLVALSGAHAQSTASAASASSTAAPVPSWAVIDPSGYTGFSQALQDQFQSLSVNPSSFLSGVPQQQSSTILGLGTAAQQLVQDQPTTPNVAALTTQLANAVCQNATYVPPAAVPTQAVGPVFTYTISGGYCVINPAGTVSCKRPSITLQTDPSFVNLAGTTGTQIQDAVCNNVQLFDTGSNGTIAGGDTVTYQLQDVVPQAPAPAPSGGAAALSAVSDPSSGGSKSHKKPVKHHSKPS